MAELLLICFFSFKVTFIPSPQYHDVLSKRKKISFFLPLLLTAVFMPQSHPLSAPLNCTSDQIEIAFLPEEGPYNGFSQDKASLFFRNISDQDCFLPARPKLHFLNQSHKILSIENRKPEEYHFRRFPLQDDQASYLLHKKGENPDDTAYLTLFWISAPVYATGVCLTPHAFEIVLPEMKWRTNFGKMMCGATQTPWYQENRLHRGSNEKITYLSALKGQPENPISLREGGRPIEESCQGQSAPPAP